MRWEQKAWVQRVLARTPLIGDRLYVVAQRRFGSLSVDVHHRMPHHLSMMRLMQQAGVSVQGARALEVGTGHHPVLPLLFSLCGVAELVTVDLNRRLQWDDVDDLMSQLIGMREELYREYVEPGLVPSDVLAEGLTRLARYEGRPREYFAAAGVRYVAPGDAGALPDLPDASVDLHFSTNVLEHIPAEVLWTIFFEAHRVVRPGGVAVHVVDPSDHFAQSDDSISLVHFLRYSAREWDRLAGNRFAYHNRLRGKEFGAILRGTGFDVLIESYDVDERSLAELHAGFTVHRDFAHVPSEELAISDVRLLARR
ncbi:methyltransferase domain-containing protein [Nocardioides sp. SYSU DS0651]|uniref:methyltransferase domain-containing protein n=1 Tax=Nocardioides sp. SYSU DS0651 TaxID=3415955 RepID=UPI003F4BB14E